MSKYRLLRERVEVLNVVPSNKLLVPLGATNEQLALVHSQDYVTRATQGELTVAEVRRIGFPWSEQMIERSRRSVGATMAAARAALQDGAGVNLAGGTHHAFADAGEGYCVFNDTACAIRVLQAEGLIRRAIVIDCDVHQGNGTASIFANDPNVFTFSMHGARNFPLRKVPSDLDVHLPDGTHNQTYLSLLKTSIEFALDASQADIVFYLAGADPFEGDRLGRLKLTKDGLKQRDHFVIEQSFRRQLPVVMSMAGGYAEIIEDLAEIHCNSIATLVSLHRTMIGR